MSVPNGEFAQSQEPAIGNLYEKKVVGSTTTHTKYYYFNGERVAVRVAGVLYWLLRDHLGSTNVTLAENGERATELRYYPYGAVRHNAGDQVTDRRFTGQWREPASGLYFYGARWYDSGIGRFIQADTIVL